MTLKVKIYKSIWRGLPAKIILIQVRKVSNLKFMQVKILQHHERYLRSSNGKQLHPTWHQLPATSMSYFSFSRGFWRDINCCLMRMSMCFAWQQVNLFKLSLRVPQYSTYLQESMWHMSALHIYLGEILHYKRRHRFPLLFKIFLIIHWLNQSLLPPENFQNNIIHCSFTFPMVTLCLQTESCVFGEKGAMCGRDNTKYSPNHLI